MPCAHTGGRTRGVRLVVDANLMVRVLLSPGPARQFFKLPPLSHRIVYHAEQLTVGTTG